ncbi:MAG: bifunctional 3,4-dihydroxy-2-butanone 4-phosphate synthase/GTP cyclohydrolase II [Proteobacteria bacterium SG_bin7]|nr:MAG: bifunctional 3,4-dihydroxy-2-butanone 4-phosphate synthase/GTP cyclohydrolase II [Proteobacteria bacterium SG_bin7]
MSPISEIIEDIRLGKMVILIDDEDRENEGDLILAADFVSPALVNFMAKEARGLICLSMSGEQAEKLQLPLMVTDNDNLAPNKTAFTVSIEASSGVTTGISAQDRARTIFVASRPNACRGDIRMPGHVFPIRAQSGGVLKRAGHTEASVDLCILAGLNPAGIICEIMNEDGTMARTSDLMKFGQKHRIKIGTIESLVEYRLGNETLVEEIATAKLPNRFGGGFQVRAFRNTLDGTEHIVVQKGEIQPGESVLVRVHSECLTGDVFGSLRCDCGQQLAKAMSIIEKSEKGVLLYLRQEGRGIGLGNKIKAYQLQDSGMDTVEANIHLGFLADHRSYGIGAQILRAIGVRKIRLLTNNPAKRTGLKGYGLEIVERIPLEVMPSLENRAYLEVKKDKMGHYLKLSESQELNS